MLEFCPKSFEEDHPEGSFIVVFFGDTADAVDDDDDGDGCIATSLRELLRPIFMEDRRGMGGSIADWDVIVTTSLREPLRDIFMELLRGFGCAGSMFNSSDSSSEDASVTSLRELLRRMLFGRDPMEGVFADETCVREFRRPVLP